MVPRQRSDKDTTGPGCPECRSQHTELQTGSLGRAVDRALADPLGLTSPDLRLRYKCRDCGHRFSGEEGGWQADALEEPCTIVLHREKWFVGSLALLTVHLNGKSIGTVANGASIEFQTSARVNTMVVVDKDGNTRESMSQTFEVESGGTATFRVRKTRLLRD